MLRHDQTLRSFASLLSAEKDIVPKDSSSVFTANNNEAARLQDSSPMLRGFLSSYSSGDGTTCTVPSLCIISSIPSHNLGDCSQLSGHGNRLQLDESVPKTVLKAFLRSGNPFPPKTSYAKGKKKLQKRRRSSQALHMAASAAIAKKQVEKESKKKLYPPILNLSAEKMVCHMSEKLRFSNVIPQCRPNNASKLFDDVSHVPHVLNANIATTVRDLLDLRLKYYLSMLLQKSIRSNKGLVSDAAARVLAHQLPDFGDDLAEFKDQAIVAQNLTLWELAHPEIKLDSGRVSLMARHDKKYKCGDSIETHGNFSLSKKRKLKNVDSNAEPDNFDSEISPLDNEVVNKLKINAEAENKGISLISLSDARINNDATEKDEESDHTVNEKHDNVIGKSNDSMKIISVDDENDTRSSPGEVMELHEIENIDRCKNREESEVGKNNKQESKENKRVYELSSVVVSKSSIMKEHENIERKEKSADSAAHLDKTNGQECPHNVGGITQDVKPHTSLSHLTEAVTLKQEETSADLEARLVNSKGPECRQILSKKILDAKSHSLLSLSTEADTLKQEGISTNLATHLDKSKGQECPQNVSRTQDGEPHSLPSHSMEADFKSHSLPSHSTEADTSKQEEISINSAYLDKSKGQDSRQNIGRINQDDKPHTLPSHSTETVTLKDKETSTDLGHLYNDKGEERLKKSDKISQDEKTHSLPSNLTEAVTPKENDTSTVFDKSKGQECPQNMGTITRDGDPRPLLSHSIEATITKQEARGKELSHVDKRKGKESPQSIGRITQDDEPHTLSSNSTEAATLKQEEADHVAKIKTTVLYPTAFKSEIQSALDENRRKRTSVLITNCITSFDVPRDATGTTTKHRRNSSSLGNKIEDRSRALNKGGILTGLREGSASVASNKDSTSDSQISSVDQDNSSRDIKVSVTEVSLPLTFAAIVSVEIGGRNGVKTSLEFGAPGSIKGTFHGSSSHRLLTEVEIFLDTDSLLRSIINQVKLVIRKAVKFAVNSHENITPAKNCDVIKTIAQYKKQLFFPAEHNLLSGNSKRRISSTTPVAPTITSIAEPTGSDRSDHSSGLKRRASHAASTQDKPSQRYREENCTDANQTLQVKRRRSSFQSKNDDDDENPIRRGSSTDQSRRGSGQSRRGSNAEKRKAAQEKATATLEKYRRTSFTTLSSISRPGSADNDNATRNHRRMSGPSAHSSVALNERKRRGSTEHAQAAQALSRSVKDSSGNSNPTSIGSNMVIPTRLLALNSSKKKTSDKLKKTPNSVSSHAQAAQALSHSLKDFSGNINPAPIESNIIPTRLLAVNNTKKNSSDKLKNLTSSVSPNSSDSHPSSTFSTKIPNSKLVSNLKVNSTDDANSKVYPLPSSPSLSDHLLNRAHVHRKSSSASPDPDLVDRSMNAETQIAAVAEVIRRRNSAAAAAEAVRLMNIDLEESLPSNAFRRGSADAVKRSSGPSNSMAADAAEVARLMEIENMASTADVVRRNCGPQNSRNTTVADATMLMEMENFGAPASARRRRSNVPNASMTAAAAEEGRLAELENMTATTGVVRRRNSGPNNITAAAAEAVRLMDMDTKSEIRRRRGNNEAARLSEMENMVAAADVMRRNSGPTSAMAASAAEAARFFELENMATTAGAGRRRSSGPNSSMAANAAEAARLVELEALEAARFDNMTASYGSVRRRRTSGPNGSMTAAAAEAARMVELENIEASVSAMRRRVNGPNKSIGANAARLMELENMAASYGGIRMRTPGPANSLSTSAAEAARLMEMENMAGSMGDYRIRNIVPNTSMTSAAEAARLLEMENMVASLGSVRQRSNGPNGSTAAADAARMIELENMTDRSLAPSASTSHAAMRINGESSIATDAMRRAEAMRRIGANPYLESGSTGIRGIGPAFLNNNSSVAAGTVAQMQLEQELAAQQGQLPPAAIRGPYQRRGSFQRRVSFDPDALGSMLHDFNDERWS